MDARKLRRISPDSFAQRKANAKPLAAALDDGFVVTEREDLRGVLLCLVGWEIKQGIGGDYSELWALAQFSETDVRQVKFTDGGRSAMGSITATLRALVQNGITSDVFVVLRGEEYDFTDRDSGVQMSATRWMIVDPADETTDGGGMTFGEGEPGF